MNTETLIEVQHLSRYYGDYCAVNDISFSVKRGEVLGLLGPNGAGKSTTMQIICGVLAPSLGSVSIAGENISESPQAAKRHLGFLPELPPLYFDLSVDEYLRYCARLRSVNTKDLSAALASSKEKCGLNDCGNRLIANLSKGFQQRVGIAQAIIHSPDVIILDEPTSGLDPNQIAEIRQLIGELSEDHSILLSTHILPEVQSSCDRVLIINRGNLVLDENIQSLNSDNQQTSCQISLSRPPLPEELESLENVLAVDVLDRQRFRITYKLNTNTPENLVKASVDKDWGLYELLPEDSSLEQVFMRLTGGEPGAARPEIEPI